MVTSTMRSLQYSRGTHGGVERRVLGELARAKSDTFQPGPILHLATNYPC